MPLALFDPDNPEALEKYGYELFGQTAEERLEKKMLGQLARLLLNPELDRCDITDEILADREMIQFLCGYRKIIVDQVMPPGSSWDAIKECLGEFRYDAVVSQERRETFVMPYLVGCLLDENRKPWFQSSPFEFVPAIEGIQTTNLGTKPAFDARFANDPRPARTDDIPLLCELT